MWPVAGEKHFISSSSSSSNSCYYFFLLFAIRYTMKHSQWHKELRIYHFILLYTL